ncbi:hypothetical protein GCM10009608_02850 [Pseudonocardia alaniniphila]
MRAWIEEAPLEDVGAAFAKVTSGAARVRVVLVTGNRTPPAGLGRGPSRRLYRTPPDPGGLCQFPYTLGQRLRITGTDGTDRRRITRSFDGRTVIPITQSGQPGVRLYKVPDISLLVKVGMT